MDSANILRLVKKGSALLGSLSPKGAIAAKPSRITRCLPFSVREYKCAWSKRTSTVAQHFSNLPK